VGDLPFDSHLYCSDHFHTVVEEFQKSHNNEKIQEHKQITDALKIEITELGSRLQRIEIDMVKLKREHKQTSDEMKNDIIQSKIEIDEINEARRDIIEGIEDISDDLHATKIDLEHWKNPPI